MKRATLFLTLVLTMAFVAMSGEQAALMKADNFSLAGTDGKTHTLDDYTNAKAVVLMFIAVQCPVSNSFNERMVELAKMYDGKDVVFLGINSNKAENLQAVGQHAQQHNFPFVVLKDDNNVVADKFQAKVTPEVYVVDQDMNVLYHGRIDDAAKESERKSADLKAALDDILAGKTVTTAQTKAFGCSIKRVSL